MNAPVVNPRETRKPNFPAVVYTHSDTLRGLADAPDVTLTVDQIAEATDRTRSNVRRDMHKLVDAGVVTATDAEPGAERLTLTDKGARWVSAMAVAAGAAVPADSAAQPGDLITVHPSRLRPDPDQPRKAFDPVKLADLAVSIRDKGVLLPILVRPEDADGFMIIAGERRWRACMTIVQAGHWSDDRTLTIKIATPADEAEAFELAVIENMQRDQLNHLEMGQSFERMATGGLSNAEIARKVGRTPEFVQQHRRLMRLDADMQTMVAAGQLSMHEALKLLAGPSKGGATPTPAPVAEDETANLWEDEGAETDFLMTVSGRLMVTYGVALPTSFYSLVGSLRKDGLSVDEAVARVARDRNLKPLPQPESLLDQPTAAAPAPEEPVEETPWTRGGFRMVKELRASGSAIPGVCSRAPVARLFMQGDAFTARYRVQVVVDFGGGHAIESSAIPGAEQGHIAVACATDDILARWPAGRSEPPRAFIEWLDKMTGKPNVVAGKFCESAEQADEYRAARGWTTGAPASRPTPTPAADDAEPPLKPRQRLILIELAHKIADQRRPLDPTGDAEWSGDAAADYLAFGAFVGSYWTDQGFNELATRRLVRAAHQPGGQGILAALTPKAVEWFAEWNLPLPPKEFTVRDAQAAAAEEGRFNTPERYATPWLATEAKSHNDSPASAQPAADAQPVNDDPWGRVEADIEADKALLTKVADWAASPGALVERAHLFLDLGVSHARVNSEGGVDLCDELEALVATIDVDPRQVLSDERVQALELLVTHAINRATTAP